MNSSHNDSGAAGGPDAVAARLQAARSLLLVTHDRPDGDGLGSMLALARAARLSGRKASLVCQDPLPRRYAFLLDGERVLNAAEFASAVDGADVVVVVDTAAWGQLESAAATLRRVHDRVVVIDHHRTRDDIGAAAWFDDSAAAAGVMVTELLARLAWPADLQTAQAAATAICSDTGWLRFANTDARALAAVGRWLDAGVKADELYRTLYETDRPQRIALMARTLGGMALHFGGRVAIMAITRADFAATGATPDETENLINEALRIGSVEVAAMLVENGAPAAAQIRASLRSKRVVDVAAVAQRFGGGGHARASGFRLAEPLPAVRDKLLAALRDVLGSEA